LCMQTEDYLIFGDNWGVIEQWLKLAQI
jgi:hypothetical protein